MKKTIYGFLLASVLLSNCDRNRPPDIPPVVPTVQGAYILSEGGFGANNTKLAYYDIASAAVAGDIFLQQNPTQTAGLGDTGNDMISYGSKIFIAMTGSNKIVVLNLNDAAFIKNVSLPAGAAPRYLAAARGKIYVSSSNNSVYVLDSTNANIIKTINVGANPEGIAANGSSLYVANSGAYNLVPDSTVSVIDLNTEVEVTRIKVGVNPNKVQVDNSGNVYVSAYGNFTNIPANVSFINASTNTSSVRLDSTFKFSHVRTLGDVAYFYNNYGGGAIRMYNTATNQIIRNSFITDGSVIQTSYALNINRVNGDIYIGDARDFVSTGRVSCFGTDGVRKFIINTAPGVNPNSIIFK
jgi:YVTN family beta-propeller protein